MIEFIFTISFLKKLKKVFGKKNALVVLDFLEDLKKNPNKGKTLTHIGDIQIKEIKYNSFRFYFIVSKNSLKLVLKDDLKDLLIKFVDLSKKNDQQEVINKIKDLLIQKDLEYF